MEPYTQKELSRDVGIKAEELGDKLAAKLLLMDHSKRIIVPTESEWFGIGLLERDDELKRYSNAKG
jgi:hypothetical protein